MTGRRRYHAPLRPLPDDPAAIVALKVIVFLLVMCCVSLGYWIAVDLWARL